VFQVIEAITPGSNGPWWEVMPQHSVLTLLGYPISNHVREPKIFILLLEDLSENEVAGNAGTDLNALLLNQQVAEQMPFLPLSSDMQVLYAQVKSLEFKNGTGVRYLTQYGNGIVPINNTELFYTYQGLTSDGRYYVSAVLPVNLNGLPMYPNDTNNLPLEFTIDHAAYVNSIVNRLDLETAYTPDLNLLDAMVGSIEVK
jgi:hypothetical protein